MEKFFQFLIVFASVLTFLGIGQYFRKSEFTPDPFIAQSTYLGPKSRLQGNPYLVKVQIFVMDGPTPGGLQIGRASFDNENIPLKPRDIYGNRGGASFQVPPGVYKLQWVVNRDRFAWPRNTSHEEKITVSPRDGWIQVTIQGDTASIK